VETVPSLLEFNKGVLKNVIKGCNDYGYYLALFENAIVEIQSKDEKQSNRVVVYTTPTCSWCNTLKSYLRKNRIHFREVDISKDDNLAQQLVKRSGQQGVPQTDINGEIVVGFNKTRINQLLNIN
jgi:glutaredoxin-like YruB-family protein